MKNQDVAEYISGVSQFLVNQNRKELADRLTARAANPGRHKPVLVVAGEDKRGKSTLVNAIVGKPDLSPIGIEVTTGSRIHLHYAETPQAEIIRYGDPTPAPVSVEDAQMLASVKGNPGNEHNIQAIRIGTDSMILKRLDIVDTPGVGGLTSGHAELTIQSLQSADAMMFVLEAGAQFRGEELEFLRRASARIDTVLLVLTKIDVHRGWRTILEDNRRILSEKAPRFATCPIIPVSALSALRAMQASDPEDVALLREESHFDDLIQAIVERVMLRSEDMREANLVRSSVGMLDTVERHLRNQKAALVPNGKEDKELEERRQRLAKINRDKGEWPQVLDREIRKLMLERNESLTRSLVAIRGKYDERLKKSEHQDRQSMPGELTAELTALTEELNRNAVERITGIVEMILDDLDAPGSLKEAISQLSSDTLATQLEANEIGSHKLTIGDKASLLTSFSTGHSVMAILGSSGVGLSLGASVIAPPVAILLGLGAGGFLFFQSFRSRSRVNFREEFRTWMMEQSTQVQVTVNSTFAREMIDVQDQIRGFIRRALEEREADLNRSVEEARALLAAEAGRVDNAAKAIDQRIEAVASWRKNASGILRQLGAPLVPEAVVAGSPA